MAGRCVRPCRLGGDLRLPPVVAAMRRLGNRDRIGGRKRFLQTLFKLIVQGVRALGVRLGFATTMSGFALRWAIHDRCLMVS
jgi:hypothetical protein